MSTSLQPLSESRRDLSLDVLRGFALAGVLFMFCVSDVGASPAYSNSLLDEAIAWFKWILVESRMYTMLILVFGIGFHVQLEKARRHNVSLVPVYTRRIIGLLLLGLIHAILLSTRDILIFYAVAGAVLLLLRNASNRQLAGLLCILFALLVTPFLLKLFGNAWPGARALEQPNDYADHLQHNWQFFKLYHQVYLIYLDMLFHFVLGFWISRSGIFHKIKTNKKFRRTVLISTLAASLLLIPFFYYWISEVFPAISARMTQSWQKFLAFLLVRVTWLTWMLVCTALYGSILIGFSVSAKTNSLRPLAAFGQMALSNYLIQSLILVPYLLLLDRFNNVPPFTGFILFLVVFALQLLFSTWWMMRYTLGPFEWLLRSFTYWRWQPVRRQLATA